MIKRSPATVRLADNAVFGLAVCALAAAITVIPLFLIHQACIRDILQ